MNHLYLVPIIVAIVVLVFTMVFSQRMKHERILKNDTADFFYGLSFLKPFVWFVNPDTTDKKVRNTNQLIQDAKMNDKLTYRSFVSIQMLALISFAFLYAILFFAIEPFIQFVGFIFNLDIQPDGQTILIYRSAIGIAMLMAILYPNRWLKKKAKINNMAFIQDLPVIQLSIILMWRANQPVNEILYQLSLKDTQYKEIFSKGYREYISDKESGFLYLLEEFHGTGFAQTIKLLNQMENYSKKDSLKVLENALVEINQEVVEIKRSKALLGNLSQQLSLAVPFGGAIILGAIPVVAYALDKLSF